MPDVRLLSAPTFSAEVLPFPRSSPTDGGVGVAVGVGVSVGVGVAVGAGVGVGVGCLACAAGGSAKPARINGIRKKRRSKDECLIVFVTGGVFIILGRVVLWFTEVVRNLRSEVLEKASKTENFGCRGTQGCFLRRSKRVLLSRAAHTLRRAVHASRDVLKIFRYWKLVSMSWGELAPRIRA